MGRKNIMISYLLNLQFIPPFDEALRSIVRFLTVREETSLRLHLNKRLEIVA